MYEAPKPKYASTYKPFKYTPKTYTAPVIDYPRSTPPPPEPEYEESTEEEEEPVYEEPVVSEESEEEPAYEIEPTPYKTYDQVYKPSY